MEYIVGFFLAFVGILMLMGIVGEYSNNRGNNTFGYDNSKGRTKHVHGREDDWDEVPMLK